MYLATVIGPCTPMCTTISSARGVPLSYLVRLQGKLKSGLSGRCMDGSYMVAMSSTSSGLTFDTPSGSLPCATQTPVPSVLGRGGAGGRTPSHRRCLRRALLYSPPSPPFPLIVSIARDDADGGQACVLSLLLHLGGSGECRLRGGGREG